jgi:hypothetical protein
MAQLIEFRVVCKGTPFFAYLTSIHISLLKEFRCNKLVTPTLASLVALV